MHPTIVAVWIHDLEPHARTPVDANSPDAINELIEDDDDDFQSRSLTRSYTQSQASSCSTSPMKITSLWDVGNGVHITPLVDEFGERREQLGENGLALLEKLEYLYNAPVVPAKLRHQPPAADMRWAKPHQFDPSDQRPMDESLWELRTIRNIVSLSHRCVKDRDLESEWNHRVHTEVLKLAFGNDETSVGFRSVTPARITSEYRPTHSNNLSASKTVDYAIHLEPSGHTHDIISSLIGMSTESINHVDYEGIRARPIAVSIKTRIRTGSMEEAQVRLGVWVAAQVARIEALMKQRASLVEENVRVVSDPSNLLSRTVFPLIDVECGTWTLYLARVTPSSALPNVDARRPMSTIRIFESVPLGNTVNTVRTYRLVKSLRVLRDWVDGDFRRWWDEVLGVAEAEAGDG